MTIGNNYVLDFNTNNPSDAIPGRTNIFTIKPIGTSHKYMLFKIYLLRRIKKLLHTKFRVWSH